MANKDGAGSITLGGMRWSASSAVAVYSATLVSPVSGEVSPSLGVPLQLIVDNNLGGTSDVQIQVATDVVFTDIIWPGELSAVVNGQVVVQPTGLSASVRYYWRARIAPAGTTTWGPWSGNLAVTEGGGGSAVSLSGGVFTAGTTLTGYPVSNAFDGNTATFWHSDGQTPSWLQVQLAAAVVVSSYTIVSRNDDLWTRPPADWTFQGSPDGATWTTLDTRTWQTFTVGQSRTFTVATSTAYLYYRLNCTVAQGGAYENLAELSLNSGGTVAYTSVPWNFMVDLNAGRAWGYSFENVGVATGLEYSGGIEQIFENVGVEYLPYHGVIEYSFENIGVPVVLHSEAVDYAYEDVNDLTPVPHLWFAYKRYGFADDHVFLYGQGLGALQTQYAAVPKLDWGPDFGAGDIEMAFEDWVIQPSMADSFGPDRRIYAGGGDSDPPFSNVETDIVEVVIPAGAVPAALEGAQSDLIYITTTGGPSNKILWVMYPTIPVAMSIPPIAVHTSAVVQVVADPVADDRIAQPGMRIVAIPYIVSGGMAMRDPLLGAISKTSAVLGV